MNTLRELFLEQNIILSDEQNTKFERYKELLLECNKSFNLTAITDDAEINLKHFLDSCLGGKYIPKNSRVVDIGSGAGFPAIPLKIVEPSLKICMLDALNKRVNFLKTVCEDLALQDTICLHERAEAHAEKNRDKYDVAVCRAVSILPTLLEYSLPLVKLGGFVVAYKGDNPQGEIENASNALKILGGKIIAVEEFLLKGEQKRSFIVVQKVAKTPLKYPRNQNKAKNSPL